MNSLILKSSNKKDAWRKVKTIYGKEFKPETKMVFNGNDIGYSTGNPDADGYIVDTGNYFEIVLPDSNSVIVEYESPKNRIAELEKENAKLREKNCILRQKILKFGKVSRELRELLTATAEFSAFLEIIETDAQRFEKEGE